MSVSVMTILMVITMTVDARASSQTSVDLFDSVSVSVVKKNAAKTTGEGPYWDESSQTLLYVDIDAGDVHRLDPVSGKNTTVHFEDTVGFVVPSQSDGYIAGLGPSIVHFEWDAPENYTTLYDYGGKTVRFNDGKCDASGRLWAGTMGRQQEPDLGSLYAMEKDHRVSSKLTPVTVSNGLAWSADNKTMYYIDSTPKKVYAFDFDLATGSISKQRTAAAVNGTPDGMTIDTEGKLWVACYGAGKVIRLDPETGNELQTVNIPAKATTSCCFGGKNYDELYVTSANLGPEDGEFTGSIFKVTGLGVKGTPPHAFGCAHAQAVDVLFISFLVFSQIFLL